MCSPSPTTVQGQEMDLKDRIGAWLTPDGCFFRVWAPNADKVTVLLQAGANWNAAAAPARHALTNVSGYWSATVPGVHAGQLYRFEIKKPDGALLQRLDAAARAVISSDLTRDDPNSHNASVVLGADRVGRAGHPQQRTGHRIEHAALVRVGDDDAVGIDRRLRLDHEFIDVAGVKRHPDGL